MGENLLDVIASKMPSLSKKQKRIGLTIMEHYDKAVFLTAAALGDLAGVSESTVVRFAMEIGYEGYPEFHRALEDLVKRELTPEQRMSATARKLDKSESHILRKVMEIDRNRLEKNMLELDTDTFDVVVDKILKAEKIYVLGSRSSTSIASFFGFYLGLMRSNVQMIEFTNTRENFENLLNVKENEICIVFSFPRYFNRTITTVKHIKSLGCEIVAITDAKISPVAMMADYVLTSPTEMMSIVDSLSAPLSLVNALLVAISLQDKENVINRFNYLEELWKEHNTYAQHNGK
ncbi:MAG: MurR/RpiR family transcriptional regulator [Lachnospirales bacterium]